MALDHLLNPRPRSGVASRFTAGTVQTVISRRDRPNARHRFLVVGLAGALAFTGCQDAAEEAVSAVSVSDEFDVQGHRGARGLKPENTLPAFEEALDLGVATLELDLHFTADGQVVVWHDPVIESEKCGLAEGAPAGTPDPDDGGSRAEPLIASLIVDQLRWFQCDRNPDPDAHPEQGTEETELAGGDFRIVTLKRLFEFVEEYANSEAKTSDQRANAAKVRFNVETKRRPESGQTIGDGFNGVDAGPFELALLDLIDRFGLGSRIVVQSFDHRSLWAVHAVDPEIRLSALTSNVPPDLAGLFANGASIWSPRATTLTETLITRAHAVGLRVIPWTVNDPLETTRLISIGVDGIITDRPDLMMGLIARP